MGKLLHDLWGPKWVLEEGAHPLGRYQLQQSEARDTLWMWLIVGGLSLQDKKDMNNESPHGLSSDEKWNKLTIDGKSQRYFFLLSGSVLLGFTGPIFVGIKTTEVIYDTVLTKHFDYVIGYRDWAWR